MADPRTFLVTGATSGIGRAAACELAGLGHRLILLGRDEAKLGRTLARIKAKRGNGETTAYRCDLSLTGDVRSAAARIRRDFRRIDVLINNAGARFLRHGLTEEGFERTMATNLLGPFVLTLSLADLLPGTGEARIINVSSGAHYGGRGGLENVRSEAGYDGKRQYAESKLALILFTYALAERLKGRRISVNALDPGCAATNFSRNNGTWSWLKHRLSYFLKGQLRTANKGAETVVYLATSSEVAEVTGRYFRDKKEIRSSDVSYVREIQAKVWASSARWAGIDL